MNRTLVVIGLFLFVLWIFAFALISTHYDPIHADQYESVEPQSLSLQRYHDINMDGEK